MFYKFVLMAFFASYALFSYAGVTDVTLYLDRALVSRTLTERGKEGINEMVFKDIPLTAGLDSVRAKGYVSKDAGLKILDIRMEKKFVKNTPVDANAINQQIEAERKNIARLNALKIRLDELRKKLEIFSIMQKQSSDKDLKDGSFNVKQWEDGLNLYSSKLEGIDTQSLAADDEIKKSNEKIIRLQYQLNGENEKDPYYSQDAYVSYSVNRETDVRILLDYMITGAGWYPIYDGRMDMKDKKLSLEYYARVFQNSGEDWNNVNLVLSTARPDLSGQLPDIYPWELDYREYVSRLTDDMKAKSMKKEEAGYDGIAPEETKDLPEGDEENAAKVDSKGLAIEYAISTKTTVLTGVKDRKVTISSGIGFKPELSWAIVPRYNNSSFLSGRIKNDSMYTFLPGELNIYMDESFIGKSRLNLINPSQEFTLSLGRDPRITADFVLDNYEKSKLFSKNKEKRKYLITVSNNTGEDVNLLIKDVIPKSVQANKISVKVIRIDPETKDIESGSVYNWNMKINKNSKIRITQEWEVEYPDNGNVIGL